MNWLQFLGILRARWLLVVAIYFLIVAGTVAISLLLPRQYTAQTQVVIDVRPDPIAGIVMPGVLAPGYMATQVDIVTSPRLATMVVDKLGIARDPVAIERFQQALDGKGSIRQFYAELLLKQLEVRPSRQSNVVNISFDATDPDFAAMVANAFAEAYVETNIAMKVEPASQQRTWFETQARELRTRLDKAQQALSAYQQDKDIVSADERIDVETARLQELSTQLTLAAAQTSDAYQRRQLAQSLIASGKASELPDVLQNPLVQQLKVNEAQLQARLQEQGAVLGRQHPEILRMQEELRSIRDRTREEVQTVVASLSRAHQVAAEREKELRSRLERQRAAVMDMKSGRDRLNVLQRDVDNAQAAYQAIAQRLTQTGLESQSSQANLFILNPAEPPNTHSSPKLLLNTLIAFVLASVLSVAAVMLWELARRRVQSADDLAEATSAPVIGQVRRIRPALLRIAGGRSGGRSPDAPAGSAPRPESPRLASMSGQSA